VGSPSASRLLDATTVAPTILFAATYDGRLMRTDTGAHWRQVWPVPPYARDITSVRTLALSPDGRTMAAGAYTSALWHSTTSGRTWQRIDHGVFKEVNDVLSLAINPLTPTILYAGGVAGLWKTTNGGESWHNLSDVSHGLLPVGQCCQGRHSHSAAALETTLVMELVRW